MRIALPFSVTLAVALSTGWVTAAVTGRVAEPGSNVAAMLSRAERALECASADPSTAVDAVISVPWVEALPENETAFEAANTPSPVFNEPPAEMIVDIAAPVFQAVFCNLCSLTVLVPTSPELAGHSMTARQEEIAAAWAKNNASKIPPEVPKDVCGHGQRQIRFELMTPATRSVADWHSSVFDAVEQLATTRAATSVSSSQGQAPLTRVIIVWEASVHPVETLAEFMTALVWSITNSSVVVGCPVYDSASRSWRSHGFRPSNSVRRDSMALLPDIARYNSEQTTQAVDTLALGPACFAASASALSRVLGANIRQRKAERKVSDLDAFKIATAKHIVRLGGLRSMILHTSRVNAIVKQHTDTIYDRLREAGNERPALYVLKQRDVLGIEFAKAERVLRDLQAVGYDARRVQALSKLQHRVGVETLLSMTRTELDALSAETEQAPYGRLVETDELTSSSPYVESLCPDREAREWLATLPSVSPCIRRHGETTTFCLDGEKGFAAVEQWYRGDLTDDTTDSTRLATTQEVTDLLRPITKRLETVAALIANNTISSAHRACTSGVSGFYENPSIGQCNEALSKLTNMDSLVSGTVNALRDQANAIRESRREVLRACPTTVRATTWASFIGSLRRSSTVMRVAQGAGVQRVPVPAKLKDFGLIFDPRNKTLSTQPQLRYVSLVSTDAIDVPEGSGVSLPRAGARKRTSGSSSVGGGPARGTLSAVISSDSVASKGKSKSQGEVRIQWTLPCCRCCSVTAEASQLIRGVSKYVDTVSPRAPDCHCSALPLMQQMQLWDTYSAPMDASHYFPAAVQGQSRFSTTSRVHIVVFHGDPTPEATNNLPYGGEHEVSFRISRPMIEVEQLPGAWTHALAHHFHEVWVATSVFKNMLVDRGVNGDKVHVIPHPIDTELFTPSGARLELPAAISERGWRHATVLSPRNGQIPRPEVLAESFKFLSVFEMDPHRGWDVLVAAYFSAFSARDNVTLYIVTSIQLVEDSKARGLSPRDAEYVRWLIEKAAVEQLGRYDRENFPHIEIITEDIRDDDLVALYRSCDAFVLPSRGENWGLQIIQALAMGLPTITTRHSAMVEYTSSNTVLYVDVQSAPLPDWVLEARNLDRSTRWGEPDTRQLRDRLRQVKRMSVNEREALGARARRTVIRRFSVDGIGKLISRRVHQLERIARAHMTAHVDAAVEEEAEFRRAYSQDRAGYGTNDDSAADIGLGDSLE